MSRIAGSLDTNVLLRLIVDDVPDQTERANQLLDDHVEFVVETTAVVEVMFVLERYYKTTRTQIAQVIQAFMESPKTILDNNLLMTLLPVYTEHKTLSAEDCVLVAQAKLRNAKPLWTFDKKLAKQSNGLAKEII